MNGKGRNPDSIISGHYKPGYGQEIRVDVAGFVDDSLGKSQYPVVAVEVMQSSNLRDEINGLKKLHGVSVVYTAVVYVYGSLNGQINETPVVDSKYLGVAL